MGSLVCPHSINYLFTTRELKELHAIRDILETRLKKQGIIDLGEVDHRAIHYNRAYFLYCPKCSLIQVTLAELPGDTKSRSSDIPTCLHRRPLLHVSHVTSELSSLIRGWLKTILYKISGGIMSGAVSVIKSEKDESTIKYNYLTILFCKDCKLLQLSLMEYHKGKSKFIEEILKQ